MEAHGSWDDWPWWGEHCRGQEPQFWRAVGKVHLKTLLLYLQLAAGVCLVRLSHDLCECLPSLMVAATLGELCSPAIHQAGSRKWCQHKGWKSCLHTVISWVGKSGENYLEKSSNNFPQVLIKSDSLCMSAFLCHLPSPEGGLVALYSFQLSHKSHKMQ